MKKLYLFLKRYLVQAKRKGSKEEWSEWTDTDDYAEAEMHAERVRQDGYDARIIENEWENRNEDQT